MPFGYHRKVLRVDLTHRTLFVEEPDEALYRKYGGGSALALYYLLKEMPAGVDPLSPDNVLVLALSVLTGAPMNEAVCRTSAADVWAANPLAGLGKLSVAWSVGVPGGSDTPVTVQANVKVSGAPAVSG